MNNQQNKYGASAPFVTIEAQTGEPVTGVFIGNEKNGGKANVEYIAAVQDFTFTHRDEDHNDVSISISTNDKNYFDIPAISVGMEILFKYGYVAETQQSIVMTIMDRKITMSSSGYVVKISAVDRGYYMKSRNQLKQVGAPIDLIADLSEHGFQVAIRVDGNDVAHIAEKLGQPNATKDYMKDGFSAGLGTSGETAISVLTTFIRRSDKPPTKEEMHKHLLDWYYTPEQKRKAEEEDAKRKKDKDGKITSYGAVNLLAEYEVKMFNKLADLKFKQGLQSNNKTSKGNPHTDKLAIVQIQHLNTSLLDILNKDPEKRSKEEKAYISTLDVFSPDEQKAIKEEYRYKHEIKPMLDANITWFDKQSGVDYKTDDGFANEDFAPFSKALQGYKAKYSMIEQMEKILKNEIRDRDKTDLYRNVALMKDFLFVVDESMSGYTSDYIQMLKESVEKFEGGKLHVSIDGNRVTIHNRSHGGPLAFGYEFESDDGILDIEMSEANIVADMKVNIFNSADPDSKTTVKGMSTNSSSSKGPYSLSDISGAIFEWISRAHDIYNSGSVSDIHHVPNFIMHVNQWEVGEISDLLGKDLTGVRGKNGKSFTWDEDTQTYRVIIPYITMVNSPYVKAIVDNIARSRAEEIEEDRFTMSMKVVGNPLLRAGQNILVTNIPDQWEGRWYIKEVKQKISVTSGYVTQLSLIQLPSVKSYARYGISTTKSVAIDEIQRDELFGTTVGFIKATNLRDAPLVDIRQGLQLQSDFEHRLQIEPGSIDGQYYSKDEQSKPYYQENTGRGKFYKFAKKTTEKKYGPQASTNENSFMGGLGNNSLYKDKTVYTVSKADMKIKKVNEKKIEE